MAVTQTSVMDDIVQTAYEKDYLLAFAQRKVWMNILSENMIREVVGTGSELAGTTIQMPIFEPLTTPTASLDEHLDVTPEAWADSNVQLTIAEEGNVVQFTRLLKNIAAYVDVGQPIAKAIGQNMVERVDRIARDAIVFNVTNTIYGGTATTRATCDTTSDPITYAKIVEAVSMAKSMGVPSFEDDTYVTICNDAVMTEITAMNQWKDPAAYARPDRYATGRISEGGTFPGEMGMLFKLRFIPHFYGKLFLGAGTPAQAATSLSAAVSAGDTTCSVADATGFAVNTYLTIGTLESSGTAYPTTERVVITAISGTDLTIRGRGNAFDNWGFKFAHINASSVIEAPNVAAIPILGPQSAMIGFASDVGLQGEVAIEWKSTDLPKRFVNHSWYWVGGAQIIDKHVVQLEVATSGEMLGEN